MSIFDSLLSWFLYEVRKVVDKVTQTIIEDFLVL